MKVESGIVLDSRLVDAADVITRTITIDRIKTANMGVRMWCIILSTDGIIFQRWSQLMNSSDEIMMLLEKGDTIEIDYIENLVCDNVSETFKSFERNLILQMRYT